MTELNETANSEAHGPSGVNRPIAWYLKQLSRLMRVLSDEELDRLIPHLTERRYDPRETIFSAGDPSERVYLVLKGRVKIFQVADNGKELILDVVERGGVLGDMAIIEDGQRVASAQCLEETVAVTISWEDFSHVLHQSPRFGFAMAELMARRVAGMQRALMSLAAKPVSARLADALLERNEAGTIRLGLTHQELAQTIATSRETVSALLGRFATLGVLLPITGGYRLVDKAMLEEIASGDLQVSPRHPPRQQPGPAAT